jgi:hypothetical protein
LIKAKAIASPILSAVVPLVGTAPRVAVDVAVEGVGEEVAVEVVVGVLSVVELPSPPS